jgi:hypothetical protein
VNMYSRCLREIYSDITREKNNNGLKNSYLRMDFNICSLNSILRKVTEPKRISHVAPTNGSRNKYEVVYK